MGAATLGRATKRLESMVVVVKSGDDGEKVRIQKS